MTLHVWGRKLGCASFLRNASSHMRNTLFLALCWSVVFQCFCNKTVETRYEFKDICISIFRPNVFRWN